MAARTQIDIIVCVVWRVVQVSTKLPVLESMLTKCDTILIGGGMMFTFSKAQVSAPLWPSILASAVA